MGIFNESSLREGKFMFKRGRGQRVSTSWQGRKISKEKIRGYVFNCGLVRAVGILDEVLQEGKV